MTFHAIAITCVVWSLYVLIEKTAEEGRSNQFDWTFWTKLIVVAIGFTGGVVFMYIQCKMYFQLCNRWRQYNRVIIIQPITEEILKKSKKNNKFETQNPNNKSYNINENNSKISVSNCDKQQNTGENQQQIDEASPLFQNTFNSTVNAIITNNNNNNNNNNNETVLNFG